MATPEDQPRDASLVARHLLSRAAALIPRFVHRNKEQRFETLDYAISGGRIWILVLVTTAVAPRLFAGLREHN